MAIFCIPKHLVEKLKNSALRGEIDIKKLYEMSSGERRDFFTKFTDKETGKFLNTEFEKAVFKNSLREWAESVFSPKAKAKPIYKNVLDKIDSLDQMGVLDPKSEQAFLQDLVAEKIGITVTADEVKQIKSRAEAIDAAQAKLGNDVGNPAKMNENISFFEEKKKMDEYLLSLSPSSRVKVLTGTVGRGMMLFSVKSPILNIGSNTELGIIEALSRRLANGSVRGTNNALALDYVKMVNKIYQKTGYDLSRMETLSNVGAGGASVLGDIVHAEGKGAIRKVGRFVEDVVFKQMMGAPDVAFASSHFADSVNLNALKLADGNKAHAERIMSDALLITPQTVEGEILRNQGILDAQVATWTNKTWASKISLGIRNILNDVSGDQRIGDLVMPFVKTPANVIATGLDYAGMGIPKALIETVNAFRTGDLKSKAFHQNVARNLVRAGLGITTAVIIAHMLKDDDFVGAYDPARAQIEALRNSNENSVRINGKWISMDWFGPISIPLTAMMYARKYGRTPQEQAFQYGKGMVMSLKQLPGIKDAMDLVSSNKGNVDTVDAATQSASDSILNFAYSRLVPGFVGDIAKSQDQFERKTGSTVATIQSKIPGLREKLPIKKNIFGENVKTEPAWSVMIFGSRLKTNTEDALIKEINTVATANDRGVSFTDWSKSNNKSLVQFRDKVGDATFQQAQEKYGEFLKSELQKTVKDAKYLAASDAEKLNLINNADTTATDKVFALYHFKYQAPKKVKK